MLRPAFIEELRSRVPISAVVGRRVKLTGKGREQQGLCPFHNEKTPSFRVNDEKGVFTCFGCGASGDVIGFEQRIANVSFIEAVERLAAEAGLEVPKARPEDREEEQRRATLYQAVEAACAWFEAQLRQPAGAAAMDYLRGRGLDEETISRFRLGWAPAGWDGLKRALLGSRYPEALLVEAGLLGRRDDGGSYDFFRGRVTFPIGDRNGRIVGFGARTLGDDKPKYLNTPGTPIFDKSSLLYGLALAREPAAIRGLAVVEGYMDVIAMHRAGLDHTVAPLGTALTEDHIEAMWRLAPEPVLCLDGDQPGRKAMTRAAERALPRLKPGRSLRFATLPAGEDPDSLLKAGRKSAIEVAMAMATPLVELLWRDLESSAQPDTPERLAAFERSLFGLAASIGNETVRRHYLAEFRKRLRERFGPPAPQLLLGRSSKNFAPRPYGRWLLEEWALLRANAYDSKVRPWLEQHGVPWNQVDAVLGGVGFVRARTVKGKWREGQEWAGGHPLGGNAAWPPPSLWEPMEEGAKLEGLVVLPAWDGGIPNGDPDGGALVDLVGWNPRTGDLYQRSGFGGVLGRDVVAEALGFEATGLRHPVRLTASPMTWLRRLVAGERWVLVVDWRRAWGALGGLSSLVADSLDLGELVDKHVRPPRLHRPEILVDEPEAAGHG